MMSLLRIFFMVSFSVLVASCDLQPKIASIPDSVGDFIYERYPALLADPETEADIYNSAASDYGIYDATNSFENNASANDYVTYASANDYIAPQDEVPDEAPDDYAPTQEPKQDIVAPEDDVDTEPEMVVPEDVLEIPESNQTAKKLDDSVVDVLTVPTKLKETEKIIVPAGFVVVQKGDTLFSIAKKNNIPVQDLAKTNNLSAPYTVKIGQKIKLERIAKDEKAPIGEVAKKLDDKVVLKPSKPAAEKVETKKQEPAPNVETKKTEPKSAIKTETKPLEKTPVVATKTKSITVGRGDTLYSVSRRYAVPVNDLAVMNNLRPPFELKSGQVLRVPNVPEVKETVKPVVNKVEVVPVKVESKPKEVKKPEPTKTKVATNEVKKANKKIEKKQEPVKKQEQKKTENKKQETKKTEKPVENKTVKKTDSPKPEVKKQTKKQEPKQEEKKKISSDPKQKLPQISARSSSKFSWPVRGKVLSNYGAKSGGLFNDGINIGAALNTSVVSAENGVVAYAGNEVKGMGNLIIIQHADGWMTVYAHLNSMSVRRGARVTVGQKIGTVGKTGKVTQPQLHFEIRKGTKAYNPINYLKK